jgi:hypothetical protein
MERKPIRYYITSSESLKHSRINRQSLSLSSTETAQIEKSLDCLTLSKEVIRFYEAPTSIGQSAQRNIPQNTTVYQHLFDNTNLARLLL